MMKRKITKLAIFDFDGTLISTPLPEFGKKHYEDKMGEPWPHSGWWGQELSLNMSIFDMPIISSVVDEFKKEQQDGSSCKVMLTGRMVKLSDSVKKILDAKDLYFDEYHYNRGGSTDVAKVKTIESLLEKYPFVEEVSLFDDRTEHIPIFENLLKEKQKSGRIKSYSITLVPANRH